MDKIKISSNMRQALRKGLLEQILRDSPPDRMEAELFDWYTVEVDRIIESMYSSEQQFMEQQVKAEVEDLNDSGMVAVNYFAKRIRYSHIVFLNSMFESYLEQACIRLKHAVGVENIPFDLGELSGDKWSVRRKFLERYGHFEIDKAKWGFATLVADIRNLLVHDNGNTLELKPAVKGRFEKVVGLRICDNEMEIESSFIKYASNGLQCLIGSIHDEISQVIARAIKPQGVK